MTNLISASKLIFIELVVYSVMLFLIIKLIELIAKRMVKIIKDDRKSFNLFNGIKFTLNIFLIIGLLFIWENYISSIITLISFLSAAFAIAIRDIIFNFMCGIYIKIKKPFKLEDRIELDNIRGDVVYIGALNFEILEVSLQEQNGQSTGVVVNFPASKIFTTSIKNITKGFKYIWNEMNIAVTYDSDLPNNKKTIYKIINNIDIVKNIPKKMKNQINEVNTTYRIYYNNYEPVIYTKLEKECIILTLRYLTHPKKARYVESMVWNKIYEAYIAGEISLYIKKED